jgi:hypothetical protein
MKSHNVVQAMFGITVVATPVLCTGASYGGGGTPSSPAPSATSALTARDPAKPPRSAARAKNPNKPGDGIPNNGDADG